MATLKSDDYLRENLLGILANSEILLMTEDENFPKAIRAYFFERGAQSYPRGVDISKFELMTTKYATIIPVDSNRFISYKYAPLRRISRCIDDQHFYSLGHLEEDITGTIMFLEGQGEELGEIARIYFPRFPEEVRKLLEEGEANTLRRNIKDGLGEGSVVTFSREDYLSALPEPYRRESGAFQKARAERING
jgi:hypothetical protein